MIHNGADPLIRDIFKKLHVIAGIFDVGNNPCLHFDPGAVQLFFDAER